jgi:hypothetical protein
MRRTAAASSTVSTSGSGWPPRSRRRRSLSRVVCSVGITGLCTTPFPNRFPVQIPETEGLVGCVTRAVCAARWGGGGDPVQLPRLGSRGTRGLADASCGWPPFPRSGPSTPTGPQVPLQRHLQGCVHGNGLQQRQRELTTRVPRDGPAGS